jgi:hypothetical protein
MVIGALLTVIVPVVTDPQRAQATESFAFIVTNSRIMEAGDDLIHGYDNHLWASTRLATLAQPVQDYLPRVVQDE